LKGKISNIDEDIDEEDKIEKIKIYEFEIDFNKKVLSADSLKALIDKFKDSGPTEQNKKDFDVDITMKIGLKLQI
jgi:hypothetical protein